MPENEDAVTTGTITTDDGERAEFEAWRASRANKSESDASEPEDGEDASVPGGAPSDDIDARIEAALARERARHADETAQLRAQLPSGTTPLNAGGVVHGENADTWSQYDQELANRGEHPLQQEDNDKED